MNIIKKEEKEEIPDILEEIRKAWEETQEHFGDKFPFEKDLPFKLQKNNMRIKGKIIKRR